MTSKLTDLHFIYPTTIVNTCQPHWNKSADIKREIAKKRMENRGIDPRTSRMLSERSTIWASSPGGWGGDQFGNMMGPFFILQNDWRLVLVLLCDQNLLSSLVSRVGKVHSNKDLIDCTPILKLYIVSSLNWMTFQTTYYNYIHFNLFGVLFLVVAYISVCSKFPSGEPGYRSPCLSNANRALYHLR